MLSNIVQMFTTQIEMLTKAVEVFTKPAPVIVIIVPPLEDPDAGLILCSESWGK